jgi:hypothetical protein
MTLAGKIRRAARELHEFNTTDLSNIVGAQSYRELRAIRDAIRDFLRRDEMERIAPGVYRYKGRVERPTLRQRLWDVARRMIRFSVKDLVQITDGNPNTIREFCQWLVRAGYAERLKPGHFKITARLKPTVPQRPRGT